ncbi:hypothetical protein WJX73_005952 [Symbiochloris irregularis]|uniref:Nitrate reductase n=1 Tax=Symbiochloris irregularis TaxID=706552 RepID=A0AAW1P0M5_9CHLO
MFWGCLPCGVHWLDEPIVDTTVTEPDPGLINADFKPIARQDRNFGVWDLAALWIGLVVSNTTWYLAGSLVELGFSWWQGILTVVLGNLITLVPLVLNAQPGTKYGIPFPVLARASFGIRGAMLPSLMRACVACGWFGIMTWVGSAAIHELLNRLAGPLSTAAIPWLGISPSQAACFAGFWLFQVGIIVQGMDAIRTVERWCAPVLLAFSAALLMWAYHATGGHFGSMLSAPSQFGAGMPKEGKFLSSFFPALTANVGYWATLSLNISDFTRHAVSQRAQVLGQALGLPLCMAAFSFTGLAVTSATPAIFGRVISDPVELLSQLQHPLAVAAGLLGLVLASLSTNIAANIVAPANAIVNISPSRISFRSAALVTCLLGAAVMPWKLIASTQGFIFTWLIGYSALLGPIAGVLIADYWLCKRRHLDVNALYSSLPTRPYWYQGGWNMAAVKAVILGILPSLPGFLATVGLVKRVPPLANQLYQFAWFVGFGTALLSYCSMMSNAEGA